MKKKNCQISKARIIENNVNFVFLKNVSMEDELNTTFMNQSCTVLYSPKNVMTYRTCHLLWNIMMIDWFFSLELQIAYWIHVFPELYFQKIKSEDQGPRIKYATLYLGFILGAYVFNYNRCRFERIERILSQLNQFSIPDTILWSYSCTVQNNF